MSSHCPFCGEGTLHRETRKVTYQYKKEEILINQPGEYCTACGESILEPADLKATRKELQAFHARVDGLVTPAEIKALRKELKLNQTEAGQLFGGGKNAFSRYERGEVAPPKSLSLLFKLLKNHKELASEIHHSQTA